MHTLNARAEAACWLCVRRVFARVVSMLFCNARRRRAGGIPCAHARWWGRSCVVKDDMLACAVMRVQQLSNRTAAQ
jgi:hypothetical protein